MKKIFLTSGIIVCMACPAFAATNITPDGKNATDPSITANCTETYLDATSGTVYFEPIWDAEKYNVLYDYGAHAWDSNHDPLTGTAYSDTILASTNTSGNAGGATYGVSYSPLAAATTLVTNATHEGYTFKGWVPDGTTPLFDQSGDLTNGFTSTTWATENLADGATYTLVAAYKANEYQITFTCGDATPISNTSFSPIGVTYDAEIGTASSTYNEALVLERCTPATGYHFNGWSCSGGVTGSSFASTDSYTYVGNSQCVAQWTQNGINLKWYSTTAQDGGTAADEMSVQTAAESCTYGSGITLPETEPTNPGYVFKGWTVTSQRVSAGQGE